MEMYAVTFFGLVLASIRHDALEQQERLIASQYPYMEEDDRVNVQRLLEQQAGDMLDLDDDDFSQLEILKNLPQP